MLNWAKQFDIFCFLDNNEYKSHSNEFECVLAAGVNKSITLSAKDRFDELKDFSTKNPEWIFGHLNYPSANVSQIGFPPGYFFIPQYIVKVSEHQVEIFSSNIDAVEIYQSINQMSDTLFPSCETKVNLQCKISNHEYVSVLQKIKEHIQRGDCYELNFCQEFFSEKAQIDPFYIYDQLGNISPNPFAALYKLEDSICLCASPERFLKKTGHVIISQPIKGTAKRMVDDPEKDEQTKRSLLESQKERSENVMIVDLVRNDLSKICSEGSVRVKELFGLYTFPQVHQLISTIEGEVNANVHWVDIVQSCYPMGSMTGAPKKRVMELIHQYESDPRDLFSGSIGYVKPNGDFDFNVVIRSIFYNVSNQYLSYKSGGGITFHSDPQKEYEESLLKASAIKTLLSS